MFHDIGFWIQSCDTCQRRKNIHPTPKAPMRIRISGEPNERIAMDVCGPLIKTPDGNEYVLAITDYFTKFTEAFPMKDQKAETIATILVEKWIHKYGQPMELHTDQGKNFESNLLKEVLQIYEIDKTRTTAFHPQSDGQVERYNKTIMTLVYALTSKTSEWDKALQMAVSAYNSTVHESTNYTPNELWYNRQLRFTVGTLVPEPDTDKPETYTEYVKQARNRLQMAYDVVRSNLKRAAKTHKKYYDRNVHEINYDLATLALIKDHTQVEKGEKKLVPKYKGPYWVLAKIGAVNYRIQETETSRPQVVHHNRMKPYFPRDPVQIPNWVKKATRKEQVEKEAQNDPNTIGNTKDADTEVRPAPRRLAKKVTVRPKKLRNIRRRKPTNPDINTNDDTNSITNTQPKPLYKTRSGRDVRPPKRD